MVVHKKLNTKDRVMAAYLVYNDQTLVEKVVTADGNTIYMMKGNHRLPRLAELFNDEERQVDAVRFAQVLETL